MANLLWGKVYYKDLFAGYLRQEPGERYTFTYDQYYLDSGQPAIAYTLPLQSAPHSNEQALPAFFDNLVAEGWLEDAQKRLLKKRQCSRFELLLAFGHDCAGAVSVIDPEPEKLSMQKIDRHDPAELAIYHNRASLSGIQPKLLLTKQQGKYHVTQSNEVSTHIAKLPSASLADILINEWLSLKATRVLLPKDNVVEADLLHIDGFPEAALIVKRFDRDKKGNKIHFEEFNQLLNLQSKEKYDGAYSDMAEFILKEKMCLPAENYILYKRVLVGILLGNTDMHLKNFAMFHIKNGLRLTPIYDQVAAAVYKPYQYLALRLDGVADRVIGKIKPKSLITLGHNYSLNSDAIAMAVAEIGQNLEAAKEVIFAAHKHHEKLRDNIVLKMEKRWNGIFNLIGQHLSKKQ